MQGFQSRSLFTPQKFYMTMVDKISIQIKHLLINLIWVYCMFFSPAALWPRQLCHLPRLVGNYEALSGIPSTFLCQHLMSVKSPWCLSPQKSPLFLWNQGIFCTVQSSNKIPLGCPLIAMVKGFLGDSGVFFF